MSVYRITFENFDLFAWMSEFGAVYFYCFRVDAPRPRVERWCGGGRSTIGNDDDDDDGMRRRETLARDWRRARVDVRRSVLRGNLSMSVSFARVWDGIYWLLDRFTVHISIKQNVLISSV